MRNDKERARWHPATRFFLVASLLLGLGATIPVIRELDDLRDVRVPIPIPGQALVYGADGFWTNSYVVAASTNSAVFVEGAMVSYPNLKNSSAITHTVSGSNITSYVAVGAQTTNVVQNYPTPLYAHTNLANLGWPIYNVKAFGAVVDGTTDDSAAVQAAVNALPAGRGGTVYVPTPIKFSNIQITNSNVRILGDAPFMADLQAAGNFAIPNSVTPPMFKVGDGTNIVRGVTFERLTLYGQTGSTNGQVGIHVNGAQGVEIKDCTLFGFRTNLLYLPTGIQPVTTIFMTGGRLQGHSTDTNCVLVFAQNQPNQDPYVTDIQFDKVKVANPITIGSFGFINDGVPAMTIDGVYIDGGTTNSQLVLRMTHPGVAAPYFQGSGFALDPTQTNWVSVLVQYTNTSRLWSDYVRGFGSTKGRLQLYDGTQIEGGSGGSFIPYRSLSGALQITGELVLADGTETNQWNSVRRMYVDGAGNMINENLNGSQLFSSSLGISHRVNGTNRTALDSTDYYLYGVNLRLDNDQRMMWKDSAGTAEAVLYAGAANNVQLLSPTLGGNIQLINRNAASAIEFYPAGISLAGYFDTSGLVVPSPKLLTVPTGLRTGGPAFGYAPEVNLAGTFPSVLWNETDAAVDNRMWDISPVAGTLYFRAITDGWAAGYPWMQVVRSGGAVSSIELFSAYVYVRTNLSVGGAAYVADDPYDATSWDGELSVPTKNAVRDKIEALVFGSGETNTTLNLGTQSATVQGLAKGKDGVTNLFRSIEAGANITITSNANTLTISATGGGGGGGSGSLTGSKSMDIIDQGGGMWIATNGFTFAGIADGLGAFSGYIEMGFLVTNATDVGSAVWTYGFVVQKDGTYSVTTDAHGPELNGAFAVAAFDDGGTFSGDASGVTSSITLSGLDVNGPPLSAEMFYRIHQFGVGTVDGVDYSGGEGGLFVNGASVSSPNFRNVTGTGTVPSATLANSGTNIDLTIGVASATVAGVITTGTQILAGDKTIQGDLAVTDGVSAQSVTVSSLSGSLPVQSDGSDGLVSEAINLASADVTGILSLGNLASGYSFANLGTGTNASLMAGNFKNTISEKADIETITGTTPTVNWLTQPIKRHVVSANITYADSNRPTAAAVGEPITIYMTNSTASAVAISLPSGWRDETGIGFTNLVSGQTATIVAQWMGTEVRYYWRTYEYPYDTVVTGAFTLRTTDHGALFNNLGASSLTTYTLPAADAGLSFEFAVADTDGIKISAAGNDTIRIAGSVTAVAGSITNSVIGGTLKLKAINSTNYYGVWSQGTWLF